MNRKLQEKLQELRTKLVQIQEEIDKLEKEDIFFDLSTDDIWFLGKEWPESIELPFPAIMLTTNGEYKDKGFYLNRDINWEIIKCIDGSLVLLPTKK